MGLGPFSPNTPRPQQKPALSAPIVTQGSPTALLKRQMAPRVWILISSGSKKGEPRYACLIEARASHRQRIWVEVSSSAPHFLHSGLSINIIKWRCLHRVLYPVRSPVTTLECTLVKNNSLILVPWQGSDIISRACCWESSRFHHHLWCWFPNQRLILLQRSHHFSLLAVYLWTTMGQNIEGFCYIATDFIRFHSINEAASSLDNKVLNRMACGCWWMGKHMERNVNWDSQSSGCDLNAASWGWNSRTNCLTVTFGYYI
jgi:hypothetical protein